MKLHEIGLKYNTDKATYHQFCDGYEEFLTGKSPEVLIEVGIFNGGSLRMWSEYYPQAKIIGLDINPESFVNEGNIHSFFCDQSNPIKTILPMVRLLGCDLFIDDGSHLWSHQLNTFMVIFPLLKAGSVYIVEDLHTSLWTTSGYADCSVNPLEFLQTYVKQHHFKHKLINRDNESLSLLIEKS